MLLLFILSGYNTVNAQHEFRLGTGFPSYPSINENFHGECDCEDRFNWQGTFTAEYSYQIEPKIKIGLSYTFESQHHTISSIIPGFNSRTTYRTIFHTILFNAGRQWAIRPLFELYSSLSIGGYYKIKDPSISNDKPSTEDIQNKFGMAYQFTPIGFRIGKKLGAFFELGFGYKGMLAGGLSYRF